MINNNLICIKWAFLGALPKAGKTIWWLLRIILPLSLLVNLLQYWGVIAIIAHLLTPIFSFIGLPGESAIVFISSIFLPLYAPIAIIAGLSLGMREITILALMCLISHNMVVETAVQKKTGSSALIMFVLRVTCSFLSAYILNKLLPSGVETNHIVNQYITEVSTFDVLTKWLLNSVYLSVKISVIIFGLMFLQSLMKEYNTLNYLTKIFAPVMKVFGLSRKSSYLWLIGQIVGLTYGSAIMIDSVENKEIESKDVDLLNYHMAISHSLLEDPMLFVAIGVPALWMYIPRFILAIIVVWMVRLLVCRV